jgi:hypothetical protein
LFLEGLLADEQRKTGWMRADAADDPGPWRQQAILGRSDWDADALRDILRNGVRIASTSDLSISTNEKLRLQSIRCQFSAPLDTNKACVVNACHTSVIDAL